MPASKTPIQSPLTGFMTVNLTVIDSPALYNVFVVATLFETLRAADDTVAVGVGA